MKTTQQSTAAVDSPQKIDPEEIVSAALKVAQETGEPVCLGGANLMGADLRGADMELADLRGADMELADLRGANLRSANLMGANLRVASLAKADLRVASLAKADLRDADLGGANLRGASLELANLRGADLRWASLIQANLTQLKWDEFDCELIGFSQYPLFAVHEKDGLRFYAGCRKNFTETEAIEHWTEGLKSSFVDVQIRAQAFICAIKHYGLKTKEST